MGVPLKEIVAPVRVEIDLDSLASKVIVLDAYNALYQFLTTIRQPDGTPLMDAYGRITSHLNGLFYRTVSLLERGVKPIYVFDGKPPELKAVELERRMKVREEAERRYIEALERGELEEARVYAQQASRLSASMVDDAKKLLDFMGIPWVQAPAEGEAQAAYMVRKGNAWASASQDYDSLLYGTPRLVRNLAITGRRKLPRKDEYIEVKPEIIELQKLLEYYGITREQLIILGLLLGTDYNPGGVKGIGSKRALKLVKELSNLDTLIRTVDWSFPVEAEQIFKLFIEPEVSDDYIIEWRSPDENGLIEFLCGEHQFSRERVSNALERLRKAYHTVFRQSTLESWFD
ncbi:MAG: flap endonuclease-1 [Thermofilaceae archaeon]|nr:flap endonuclease-1 [Thermofilaceae archaeon]